MVVSRATHIPCVAIWVIILLSPVSVWALDEQELEPYEGILVTRITLSGNNVTKDYIIRREFETKVGEPLDVAAVRRDVQRLDNLGIFSSVHVTASDYAEGVALEVAVRELPWIIPYLKFKYTEENGFSIGPTVSSVNMLGRDIYLTGFVLFGGTTTFSARFEWPWIASDHLSLELLAEHLERTNEIHKFAETTDEFTPWVGHYLGENGRIRGMLGYFGVKSDQDGRTLSPDKKDDLIRWGAAIAYDRRDDWLNTHDGWQAEIQTVRTGGFLGGDGDFWTTDFDLRRHQPIVNERHTLAFGGLTTIQTGRVAVDVPIYMQYSLGGANTIRGYDTNELDQRGIGKNQLILTAEYQYLVWPIKEYMIIKWPVTFGAELAVFTDGGIAWSEDNEFGRKRWKQGYGLGMRALVPAVNEVRFDIGFSREGGVVFHLGVWPKFDAQRLRLR